MKLLYTFFFSLSEMVALERLNLALYGHEKPSY